MAANSIPAELLDHHRASAVLLSDLSKIRKICGFTGSRALLVIRAESQHLLTDPRYAAQADGEVHNAEVIIGEGSFCSVLHKAQLLRGGSVLFESDHLTVAESAEWQEAFPAVTWLPGKQLLSGFMACKTNAEVGLMRKAQAITEAVFEQILDIIRPGQTEREIAAEIVYAHLCRGAERMAFDPIVASGPRSALPHARPTDRPLQEHETVLLDFGCVYQGYASDMTRIVALGTPADEVYQVHEVVYEAQSRALAAATAHMSASALDAVARRVITKAGFGSGFTHSLGHGIGLEVHEWPRVSKQAKSSLPPGATITIEPGVYLAGKFGIRIEDTVVLRERGCERLGSLARQLFIV